ncbi:MAG TPA: adenylate kinase [Mycobacteriales bacterium]|nr:adenylate kinase [Mycobacteriales bacterium]
MKLLLIGPPGSGKGTQGDRLAQRFGLAHIAAGDLLRAEVQARTPIGRAAAAYLDRGDLVPDEVVIELVVPVVIKAVEEGKGYVLDGFPRSVGQAKVARGQVEEAGATPDAVIYLDVSREELVRRILARATIEGRSDDTAEVVRNRLHVFDEATHPLVDYYRDRGLLRVVDANRSEDEVAADILAAVGDLAEG